MGLGRARFARPSAGVQHVLRLAPRLRRSVVGAAGLGAGLGAEAHAKGGAGPAASAGGPLAAPGDGRAALAFRSLRCAVRARGTGRRGAPGGRGGGRAAHEGLLVEACAGGEAASDDIGRQAPVGTRGSRRRLRGSRCARRPARRRHAERSDAGRRAHGAGRSSLRVSAVARRKGGLREAFAAPAPRWLQGERRPRMERWHLPGFLRQVVANLARASAAMARRGDAADHPARGGHFPPPWV